MNLKVNVDKKCDGVYVISPIGSIDSGTHEEFKKSIDMVLKLTPKAIVFDMKSLEFITSIGISDIIYARKNLEKTRGLLLLTNFQSQIKKVFDVMKVFPAENIFANMEEVDIQLAARGYK